LKQLFFILFISWLSNTIAKAQNFNHKQIEQINGLSSRTVYSLLQDSLGFVWMGTEDGLMRYDGHTFKKIHANSLTSLPGSQLKLDDNNKVWYQNFDGFVYRTNSDSLLLVDTNKPNNYASYGLSNGIAYIPQKNGIDIVTQNSSQLQKTIIIDYKTPEHGNVIGQFYYFIADDIIYQLNQESIIRKSDYFKNVIPPQLLKVKLIFGHNEEVFVFSKYNETHSFYIFNDSLQFLRKIDLPIDIVLHHVVPYKNSMLLLTNKGLYTFYPNQNKPLVQSFNGLPITDFLIDFQNNIWISTINNGVFVIKNNKETFYKLPISNSSTFASINNGLFIGTHNGYIYHLDENFNVKESKSITTFSESISRIFTDTNSNKFYFTTHRFNNYLNDKYIQHIKDYNVALKNICRIDDKYQAVATSSFCGLFYDPIMPTASISSIWDSSFKNNIVKALPEFSVILKGVRGKSVDFSKSNRCIVFSTNQGLYKVNANETREISNNGLPFYATDLFWINQNVMLLDTKGDVYCMNEKDSFILLNQQLSIQSKSVKRMKKFGEKIVLIGDDFVNVYDANQLNNCVFRKAFNSQSKINDVIINNNELLLLSDNGVSVMGIKNEVRKVLPRFYINLVTANDLPINHRMLTKLNYKQNKIVIQYSILDYSELQIPFFYKINDGPWVLAPKHVREILFPSLSPGAYSIQFKIGEKILENKIEFKIEKPIWMQTWVWIIGIIVLGILIKWYYSRKSKLMQNQISLLNEKVKLEKELSKSVMTAIKSQMNPHFFYNALNTIQAFIFTNEKEKANNYLAKFSKLTRLILEMSDQETISLSEEIASLKLYLELERMRFSEGFEYKIQLKNITQPDRLELPSMLIQPFVENAIKHGLLHAIGPKRVDITFMVDDDNLTVIVDDNGIGRAKSRALNEKRNPSHQSFAIKANKKRISILNQKSGSAMSIHIIDKQNGNGEANGTQVIIKIPIN
jgi:hypothetical protein